MAAESDEALGSLGHVLALNLRPSGVRFELVASFHRSREQDRSDRDPVRVPVGDLRGRVGADQSVEQLDLLGDHGSGFSFEEAAGVSER